IPLVQGFLSLLQSGSQITAFFNDSSIGATALKTALLGLAIALGLYIATLIPGMIAGLIGLAAAAWTAAAGVIAATWPFILIGLAIAGLIVGIKKLYENWTGFHDLVNKTGVILQNLWHWLSEKVGAAF